MDLLLELLLEPLLELLLVLLLLLLCVPYHVDTREPSCNARNKMELPERTTSRKHLYGTFYGFAGHFMTGRPEGSTSTKHLDGTKVRR